MRGDSPSAEVGRKPPRRCQPQSHRPVRNRRGRPGQHAEATLIMGDSGEGLVDAEARIQEQIEEREAERRRRGGGGPKIDPEKVRESSNRFGWPNPILCARRRRPSIPCVSSRSSWRSLKSTSGSAQYQRKPRERFRPHRRSAGAALRPELQVADGLRHAQPQRVLERGRHREHQRRPAPP